MMRFLMLLACVIGTAHAATFEVPVQGSQSLTLAIAEPYTPAGDPKDLARSLRRTVERDLDMTGYFRMVGPEAHIERGKGVEPGEFSFEDWKAIRVAALAKLRILPAGDPSCDPVLTCVDVYVYDVLGGEKLAGKRLKAGADQPLSLAHEAANVILLALVGEIGFFGQTVAAVSQRSGKKEIVTMPLGGGAVTSVTANATINLSPGWNSAKTSIAYTTFRRGGPDVYAKDLDTGRVRVVSATQGLDASPAYSPDGRTMALARSSEGDTDLWLLDARTGAAIRRLTQGGGIDVSPHFSPDGTKIVFASERSGGSQIYEMPVAGGAARRVTTTAGFYTDPAYSPDGTRIAFVSRSGVFDIMTVRTDGTGLLRITQDAGDNEDPSWSPDGRYLLFSSTRGGRQRLWISTSNGRHQVAVTEEGGWSQPTWTR